VNSIRFQLEIGRAPQSLEELKGFDRAWENSFAGAVARLGAAVAACPAFITAKIRHEEEVARLLAVTDYRYHQQAKAWAHKNPRWVVHRAWRAIAAGEILQEEAWAEP
jgi:hypothetical protein